LQLSDSVVVPSKLAIQKVKKRDPACGCTWRPGPWLCHTSSSTGAPGAHWSSSCSWHLVTRAELKLSDVADIVAVSEGHDRVHAHFFFIYQRTCKRPPSTCSFSGCMYCM